MTLVCWLWALGLTATRVVPPPSVVPADDTRAAAYYQNVGDCFASWGCFEAAIPNYEKSLSRQADRASARLGLARALLGRGMGLPALEQVKAVLAKDGANLAAQTLFAQLVLQAGQPREAERSASAVLAKRPGDREARQVLALSLLAQKRYGEAEKALATALRTNPDDPTPHKLLGQLYLLQQQPAQAIKALRKYVDQRPSDLQVVVVLADLYAAHGYEAEAVELGRQLVAQEPRNPRLMLGLAGLLVRIRQPAAAAAVFARVLPLTTDPRLLLPALGFLAPYQASQQRFAAAVGYAQRLVELQPNLLPPRLMVLQFAVRGSLWGAALGAARALVALQPEHVGFRMQLFDICLRSRSWATARRVALELVRRWPDRPQLAGPLAQGFLAHGRLTEAVSFLEAAAGSDPRLRPLRYLLFQIYRRLGRDQAAIALLEALHRSDPNDPIPRHELSAVAFRAGRWERVVELLSPLIERRQISPDAAYALAWSCERTGLYPQAAAIFERIAVGSRQPLLYLNVVRQYEKMGNQVAAASLCRRLLSSYPKHVPTLIAYGRALGNSNDFEGASRVFQQVLGLAPGNPLALRSLGLAAQQQGRLSEAYDWYRQLAAADPRNGTALLEAGDMQAAQQQLDAAIATWLEGLQRQPNSAALHARLGDAYAAQGKWAEAVAEYTAAVQRDVASNANRLALAEATAQAGRPAEARRWYRELLDRLPESNYLYQQWLGTFAAEGQGALGLESGLQLLGQRPHSAALGEAVVSAAQAAGELPLLGRRVDELLTRRPTRSLRDTQGLATGVNGGDALGYYRELAQQQPGDALWQRRLGTVAEAAGDLPAALRAYEQAVRLSPRDVGATSGLARQQQAIGADERAQATLRRLLALNPQSPTAYLELVRAYDQDGAAAEARAGLLAMLNSPPLPGRQPAATNNAVLTAYGLACELSDRPDEAADAYRRALQLSAFDLAASSGLRRVTRRAGQRRLTVPGSER
ncbi:MAG: tetratricopeptide repeat protein [Fimbriimonadaceae bacterium]|nr:tetratricopeptide repeat protein [Fimbriimonadaceae bacterium]